MTQLGSATPIAAVGFSIWIEALTQLARPAAQDVVQGSLA
jgi:ATP phosphoribosyltransferase regulatory subunit